jgi:hypothetical protein
MGWPLCIAFLLPFEFTEDCELLKEKDLDVPVDVEGSEDGIGAT